MWFEETRGEYAYVVDNPRQRPKGAPAYRDTVVEVSKSCQTIRPEPGDRAVLEYILMDGLATDRIVGETASTAVYQLYRLHFIDDDVGLSYLYRFAKPLANGHAAFRLGSYISPGVDDDVAAVAADSINALNKDDEGFYALCERVMQQLPTNTALRHAIEAVKLSSEEEDVQNRNVRQLVEGAATDDDYAIAYIVSATCSGSDHNQNAMLGLRAVQRLATDPTFRSRATGFTQGLIGQPQKNKRMLKFLKQQFGRQRL